MRSAMKCRIPRILCQRCLDPRPLALPSSRLEANAVQANYAVESGDLEVLQLALEHLEPRATSDDIQRLLSTAARLGLLEVV
ncbi:hypothetical protein PybrP1_004675 [[Pythium] brassicae (nom. inval.)]|nr:hypothetical protein PybrP1_004675 [[Pythium] brassicae (nom. inval.)]